MQLVDIYQLGFQVTSCSLGSLFLDMHGEEIIVCYIYNVIYFLNRYLPAITGSKWQNFGIKATRRG